MPREILGLGDKREVLLNDTDSKIVCTDLYVSYSENWNLDEKNPF